MAGTRFETTEGVYAFAYLYSSPAVMHTRVTHRPSALCKPYIWPRGNAFRAALTHAGVRQDRASPKRETSGAQRKEKRTHDKKGVARVWDGQKRLDNRHANCHLLAAAFTKPEALVVRLFTPASPRFSVADPHAMLSNSLRMEQFPDFPTKPDKVLALCFRSGFIIRPSMYIVATPWQWCDPCLPS